MAPLLRGQAHVVLLYSLISATALSDHASTHLVLRYSLISAMALSVSASTLLLCATTPQYCTKPLGTYCAVSYSFLIIGLVTPPTPAWADEGARGYIGTLYLLFQTLVCPSLITESKYHIQGYKIKKTTVVVFIVSIHTVLSPIYIYIYKNYTFTFT